jgi:hypothetical protein
MTAFRIALLTLAFSALAHARPVVMENVFALVAPPDPSWEILGGFGVAIDGDYALVSGERYVADASAPSGVRHDAAVFIYKRSGTSWNYTGRLGPIAPIASAYPPRRGALAMKNGIAMTITDRWRIFARTGDTFALESGAGILPTALNGPDIEIDGGRILAAYWSCSFDAVVLRKIGSSWKPEGQLFPRDPGCSGSGDGSTWLDIEGDRAAVANQYDAYFELGRATAFRLDPSGAGWIDEGQLGGFYSPARHHELKVALAAPFIAFGGTRISVGSRPGASVTAGGSFEAVDSFLAPFDYFSTLLERAAPGTFAHRSFSFDRGAYIINLIRLTEAEPRALKHIATLQSRSGASLGTSLDVSGNRVIVNGRTPTGGDNSVRIFELPPTFEAPAVQYHDFQNVAEGALWQRAPGSTFNIVKVDKTNVFRQPNYTAAAAWLPGSATTNQGIQAEITTGGNGQGGNFGAGLVTRRIDQNNYYFAIINPIGKVELKRITNGVFATLGTAAMPIDNNKKHRLRLESIGSAHRVYFDDRQLLEARDFTFAAGAPGIMTNGVQADFDNVIVSPTPYTTIYSDNFGSSEPEKWYAWAGAWQAVDGVFRQSSNYRFARIATGAPTDDQIVRARIKPTSFVAENNWVGLFGRFLSDDFYLYVSLHERDVIALWTRNGSTSTQLATARLPVNVGTWYDVRLEVVNNVTRVFVDDKLILTSYVDPGPVLNGEPQLKGQVGLITYQATADYDDFISYQP